MKENKIKGSSNIGVLVLFRIQETIVHLYRLALIYCVYRSDTVLVCKNTMYIPRLEAQCIAKLEYDVSN